MALTFQYSLLDAEELLALAAYALSPANAADRVSPGSTGSENGTRTPAWADKAERTSAAIAGQEMGRRGRMGSAYPNAGRPVKRKHQIFIKLCTYSSVPTFRVGRSSSHSRRRRAMEAAGKPVERT